jgi:hypothetical protein
MHGVRTAASRVAASGCLKRDPDPHLPSPHVGAPLGLRILTRTAQEAARDVFSPFEALSPLLWLSLAGTALLVGCVVWCLDVSVKSLDRPPLPKPHARRRLKGRSGDSKAAASGMQAPTGGSPGGDVTVLWLAPEDEEAAGQERPSRSWWLRCLGVRQGEELEAVRLLSEEWEALDLLGRGASRGVPSYWA